MIDFNEFAKNDGEKYTPKNQAAAGGGSMFPACQADDDPKSDADGGIFFFEDCSVADFDGYMVKGARAGKLKRQDGTVLTGVFIDAMLAFILDGGRRRVQVWRREESEDGTFKPRSTTMIYAAIVPAKGAKAEPKIVRIVGRGAARAKGFWAAMKPIRDAGAESHVVLVSLDAGATVKSDGDKPRNIRTIRAITMKATPPALAEWADTIGMPAATEDADRLVEAAKAREAREEEGRAIQEGRGGGRAAGGAARGGAHSNGAPPDDLHDTIPF